jgi:hypothetical protein
VDPVAENLVEEELDEEPTKADRVEELEEHREVTEEEEDLEQEEEEEEMGELPRFEEVSAAVLEILEGDGDVDQEAAATLTDKEKNALEVLERVVAGPTGNNDIDAEERLEMLNASIAALQPALAAGIDPALAEMRERYDAIVADLGDLRELLERMVDAEEMEEEEEEKEAGSDEPPEGDEQPKSDTGHATFWMKKARKFAAAKKGEPGARPPDPGPKPDPDLGVPPRESTLFGKPGEPAVEPAPRGPSTAWDGDPDAR